MFMPYKKSRHTRRPLFLVIPIFLFAATMIAPSLAGAHAPGASVFGTGTATIDGVMNAGEWEKAGHIDLAVGSTPLTLFVMNDADNLYFAVRTLGVTAPVPSMFIGT